MEKNGDFRTIRIGWDDEEKLKLVAEVDVLQRSIYRTNNRRLQEELRAARNLILTKLCGENWLTFTRKISYFRSDLLLIVKYHPNEAPQI